MIPRRVPLARGALALEADELRALGRHRLAALLPFALRTRFWADRLRAAAHDPADASRDPDAVLRALEPVTKRELRLAGRAALLDGWRRPWWPSSSSSGSTGEPFRVHYDPRAWLTLKYATKLRAREACGLGPRDRVAILDAIPVAEEGRALVERLGAARRVSVLQSAEAVARKLAAFAPDALYGLPSALLEASRGLAARGARPPVRLLFTSGELLQPSTRRALADAFGAPVFDVYGSSETKEIAWECPRGAMHVNADVLRVEALGRGGQPAADGEEGDLVVTVLVNRAMPLLRYRTGDRGALLAGRCDCGCTLPLLGIVAGREADVLDLAGRRVSPYALTTAIERIEGLLQYQVSQVDRARLRVRAVPATHADRSRMDHGIRSALRRHVEESLDVDVEFVERLPTGARAKVRVVEPLDSRRDAGTPEETA
ncbi:MAG TPA: hypothetical protein VFU46_06335 [Gemmatimonadales bacterium]|nr:hypothetical protein [Gemmatimonadales bacterium]